MGAIHGENQWKNREGMPYHARIQGGPRGPWRPPPQKKILFPQIVRRGPRGPCPPPPPPPPGAKRALAPPYKILDPPMHMLADSGARIPALTSHSGVHSLQAQWRQGANWSTFYTCHTAWDKLWRLRISWTLLMRLLGSQEVVLAQPTVIVWRSV